VAIEQAQKPIIDVAPELDAVHDAITAHLPD